MWISPAHLTAQKDGWEAGECCDQGRVTIVVRGKEDVAGRQVADRCMVELLW